MKATDSPLQHRCLNPCICKVSVKKTKGSCLGFFQLKQIIPTLKWVFFQRWVAIFYSFPPNRPGPWSSNSTEAGRQMAQHTARKKDWAPWGCVTCRRSAKREPSEIQSQLCTKDSFLQDVAASLLAIFFCPPKGMMSVKVRVKMTQGS